jgi:hypothetical protein
MELDIKVLSENQLALRIQGEQVLDNGDGTSSVIFNVHSNKYVRGTMICDTINIGQHSNVDYSYWDIHRLNLMSLRLGEAIKLYRKVVLV